MTKDELKTKISEFVDSIQSYSEEDLVRWLGIFVDSCLDYRWSDEIDLILNSRETILDRELSPGNRVEILYFLANAYFVRRHLADAEPSSPYYDSPDWEQEVILLRSALKGHVYPRSLLRIAPPLLDKRIVF